MILYNGGPHKLVTMQRAEELCGLFVVDFAPLMQSPTSECSFADNLKFVAVELQRVPHLLKAPSRACMPGEEATLATA